MSRVILIVDDEKRFARYVDKLLSSEGYQTSVAHCAAEAREKMPSLYPDIVLLDLKLPDADGGDLLTELKRAYPETVFIVVTAYGSIPSAVESTRRGAANYLTKPFESAELLHVVQSAAREVELSEEVRRLRSKDAPPAKAWETAYTSAAMHDVLELASHAASQDGIVLLLGDSGTGKDHLARWIHNRSRRAEGPFFAINCAALSKELAESELFGHEPGAFTGTRGRKRGLLELARDGTILLNEIGELDLALQAKLLTFLDSRTFVRVGGEKNITVSARIFAATNRDLAREVDQRTFRQDLFYRLNVFPIRLPSLRNRVEDLPVLVEEILEKLAPELGLSEKPVVTPNAMRVLAGYQWPGNVRELRNVLERTLMMSPDGVIKRSTLNLTVDPSDWSLEIPFPHGKDIGEIIRQVEREIVLEALRRSKTKQLASKLLNISRHQLAYRMKVLGISNSDI